MLAKIDLVTNSIDSMKSNKSYKYHKIFRGHRSILFKIDKEVQGNELYIPPNFRSHQFCVLES